jgi:hypothetical protein
MSRWVKFTGRIGLLAAFFWAGASSTEAALISDDFGSVSKKAPAAEPREIRLPPEGSLRLSSRALAASLATFALLGLGTLGYVWWCKRASSGGFLAGHKWHHRAQQEWSLLPGRSLGRSILAKPTVHERKGAA